MAAIFLDTSAVVKRYVDEAGSRVVRELTAAADAHISEITIVECIAALCRQGREGRLTSEQVLAALRRFREEASTGYELVGVTSGVIAVAGSLAERHVLRGYDAVQVASALSVQRAVSGEVVTLVTADGRMCEVGREEGMDVIDPTDAPTQ